MSIIVGTGFGSYAARMTAALLRLLTLIALVLMPLGMTGAPALAAPDHHTMVAGSGHCDAQQDQNMAPDQEQMDCTAACTALPAPSTSVLTLALKPTAPRAIGAAVPFTSINLEIATPPPKFA